MNYRCYIPISKTKSPWIWRTHMKRSRDEDCANTVTSLTRSSQQKETTLKNPRKSEYETSWQKLKRVEENKERPPPPLPSPQKKETKKERKGREKRGKGEMEVSIRRVCVRCYSINEKGQSKTRTRGGFAEGVCERGWVEYVRKAEAWKGARVWREKRWKRVGGKGKRKTKTEWEGKKDACGVVRCWK